MTQPSICVDTGMLGLGPTSHPSDKECNKHDPPQVSLHSPRDDERRAVMRQGRPHAHSRVAWRGRAAHSLQPSLAQDPQSPDQQVCQLPDAGVQNWPVLPCPGQDSLGLSLVLGCHMAGPLSSTRCSQKGPHLAVCSRYSQSSQDQGRRAVRAQVRFGPRESLKG